MGLPPGRTNNPAGKPKGTPSKHYSGLRRQMNATLKEVWPRVDQELAAMTGKPLLDFVAKLLPYAAPKIETVSPEKEVLSQVDKMRGDELSALAEKLLENMSATE